MRIVVVCAWLLVLGGCQAAAKSEPTPAPTEIVEKVEPSAATQPVPASAATALAAATCDGDHAACAANTDPPLGHTVTGGQLYGAPQDDGVALVALSDLMAEPKSHVDHVVRTEGTIARVCQHRGCWLELQADSGGAIARVPMAGHAFFVPPDSSGRRATVQGKLTLREGTANPVRIDATSVLIAELGASPAAPTTRSN